MALEIASSTMRTEVMDHHGLTAGICRELKLAERINARIGSQDSRRIIQPGTAVNAMIINGLGFTNRRLYLTPQFFQSKAIEQLLGEGIQAEHLDDHALGKALDEIADYGPTKLYGEIAFELLQENGLLGSNAHLDTTSFALQGQDETKETATIEVTYGFSKDHRPDLKQVMLSMAVTGPAELPFWMEPQDGNSSDKTSFHETIQQVRQFQRGLKGASDFLWVADSALYSKEKLLASNAYLWISRVPETLMEAKYLAERPSEALQWKMTENGYSYSEHQSCYGGIAQRWLLVYSEQAYQRESKTFERKLTAQEEEAKKALWHLGNQVFFCDQDARDSAEKLAKQYHYHRIRFELEAIQKFKGKGRPSPGQEKEIVGFKVLGQIERDPDAIGRYLNRKGRFILATNQLDTGILSSEDLLRSYKDQQGVERGFRFLKDPWFMVDSFFVKKRSRLSALMMVMTLCLFVYNYGQHKMRQALEKQKETLPNQINQPVENPTLRWVFQLMEGIAIVKIYDPITHMFRALITNLNELRIKIIRLLGDSVCVIYGILPEIAGM